jgi:acetyltransferase-like isoleucine patch superfamily enzyme
MQVLLPHPRLILLRVRLGARLRVGRGARVGKGVRMTVAPGAHLSLGARCSIGDGTRIDVAAGSVELGGHATLGTRCVIAARDRVTVGAHARLGDEVVLIDFDHGTDDVESPVRLQGLPTAPIVIGDRARIDYGAAILRGVGVGAGAHVGARSVVVRDVAPDADVQGIPAHAPKGPRRQRQVPAPPA